MLFKVLKRAILRHQNIEDIADKIDIFLAADKITIAEYEELVALLDQARAANQAE